MIGIRTGRVWVVFLCAIALSISILLEHGFSIWLFGFLALVLTSELAVIRKLPKLFLIADSIWISFIVLVTGSGVSPFHVLYLLSLASHSIIFGINTGVALSFIYAAIFWVSTHYITLPNLWLVPASTPMGNDVLQLVGLLSAMILISALSSYLGRTVKRTIEELNSATENAKAFLDKLPDPIITLDSKDIITSMNLPALHLFQNQAGENVSKIYKGEPLLSKEGRYYQPIKKTLSSSKGETQGFAIIFQDITELVSVKKSITTHDETLRLLADRSEPSGDFNEFFGDTPVIKKVFSLVTKVACTDSTVLITGESGTGKELIARSIHRLSTRAHAPFVPVNCGAIPEQLLEAEFFGAKKGSYTGATADRIGFFEQAQGGTIFLDEIGELPLSMQVKLLRAIQEKRIRPVGASSELDVDIRIVAATNKNLKQEVSKEAFREDLFYRLNVISIPLPPLRERKEDLPILISGLVKRLCRGREVPKIAPSTIELLSSYDYPGNVRELENLLERAIVLGGDVILPEHFPDLKPSKKETQVIVDESIQFPFDLDAYLSGIERRYIEAALLESKGMKKRAAELLKLNFRSFRYRVQKYQIAE